MCALILEVCTIASMGSLCYIVNVVRRIPATIIVGLITFFIGIGSALNINILINQVSIYISYAKYYTCGCVLYCAY